MTPVNADNIERGGVHDPDFTIAGSFLNAEVPDENSLSWQALEELGLNQNPVALPVVYFAGTRGYAFRPFEGSSVFTRQEAYIADRIFSKPVDDTSLLEERAETLEQIARSDQLPRAREALVGMRGLTNALYTMLCQHADNEYSDNWDMLYEAYVMRSKDEVYAPDLNYRDYTRLRHNYAPTDEAMELVLASIEPNRSIAAMAESLGAIDPRFSRTAENLTLLGERIADTFSRQSVDSIRQSMDEYEVNEEHELSRRAYEEFLSTLPGYGYDTSRYYVNPEWGSFNPSTGNWAANLDARVVDLGVVVTFASMISEDGWDRSIPGVEGIIEGAWKPRSTKNAQTPGQGFFNDYPIVGLVSPNGSGKTFATERDFTARIAKQTIGHAPAERARNYLPQSSFNMLGRFNSHGRGDHGELVNELQRWKYGLDSMGERPLFYLDEAISTASPYGQAALNLAFARYVEELGGSVSVATHNEHVASMLQRWSDAGLYTFTDQGEEKHVMIEGVADSGFIDVARQRGLPEVYALHMESYLEGAFELGHSPAYPEVPSGFSEQERIAMMVRGGGLSYMFPDETNSPAYVLLSDDAGALQGYNLEQTKLLYYSDPVPFQELVERRRSMVELSDYEQLEDLAADIDTLGLMDAYMMHVSEKAPTQLLQELNPLTYIYNFYKDEESGEFDPSDIKIESVDAHLILKIDAYMELLQALYPSNEALSGLRAQLDPLYKQIDELEASHVANAADVEFWQKDRIVKEYRRAVAKVSSQAIAISFQAISDFDIDSAEVNFWRNDDARSALEKLSSPAPQYDNDSGRFIEVDVMDASANLRNMESLGVLARINIAPTLAALLLQEPDISSSKRSLAKHYDAIDSVHVRQAVSHLQSLFEGTVARKDEQEAEGEAAEPWHSDFSPLTGKKFHERTQFEKVFAKQSDIAKELSMLSQLTELARKVASGEYSLTNFNSSGDIDLRAIRDLGGDSKHHPFDYSVGGSSSAVALSGEHSAGKTYSSKHVASALLLAMKIGVAPAGYASLPYFERISYIDRVAQEMDADRSAGQQEIDIWADHDRILSGSGTAITFADEIGSSTSPKYQAAFGAAVAAVNSSRGHRTVVTTHHDGYIDFIGRQDAGHVQGITRDQSGKRTISNEKIISNPIPFASDIGLPKRLIELAEGFYAELTAA